MSSYNLNYTFNDQLRDVPENPKDVLNYILEEQEKLKSIKEPKKRVAMLGKIGSFARMLEELDDAEAFLGEALELISEYDLGVRLWVANGIRLAHVYQWMGAFDIAEEMFFNIIEMCEEKEEVSDYLHFASQHFGKFYFDLEEYEEALEYFEDAIERRKIIGDDALIKSTQFAIDVTKKHIKEDNVLEFPSSKAEVDEIQSATDFSELIREIFTDEHFESIEEANHQLQQFSQDQNRLSKDSFLGLSPEHIHHIIYKPFSLNNALFSFECSDIKRIKEVPLVNQALYIMNKLKKVQELKGTQKGNFPKIFVIELYEQFFTEERYTRKPNKEDDLPQITRLKHLLDMSGLIKKRKNKFSLTKKGEAIIDKDNNVELFKMIINSFFNKWNWAYGDGYSELQLIQSSAVFNLYLLHKKAKDWILGEDLGQVFLDAFPALVNEVTDSYFGPEKEIISCFSIRFLDRVCLPLGILKTKEEGKGFERKVYYKTTNVFDEVFDFIYSRE